MIGVYRILNQANGRSYVGQSTDIKKRIAQHFSDLRAGRHDNSDLQAEWLLFGPDSFVWEVLERTEKEALCECERKWIEALCAFSYGYNMTSGGLGTPDLPPWDVGIGRSESVRQAISNYAKTRTGERNPFFGRQHSDSVKERLRDLRSLPVRDVETGVVYTSAKAADVAFGGKSSNVSKALNGRCLTAYGRRWENV